MDRKVIDEVTKRLVDEGKLIEAGFEGLKLSGQLKGIVYNDQEVANMRTIFFAGAQHLFASIMSFMDSDREPTENDLRRMDQVHSELETFVKELKQNGEKLCS